MSDLSKLLERRLPRLIEVAERIAGALERLAPEEVVPMVTDYRPRDGELTITVGDWEIAVSKGADGSVWVGRLNTKTDAQNLYPLGDDEEEDK